MKCKDLKCIGIMQDNLCHLYILSTTVLSDHEFGEREECALKEVVHAFAHMCAIVLRAFYGVIIVLTCWEPKNSYMSVPCKCS